ncbi:MAG TPA: hypothetical protein VN775_04755 [Opitutaceae bacterium]|nr:hypothetical protein [Opitutaceae bacterium]
MSLPSRRPSRAWFVIPLCAFGFLVWTDTLRVRRVDYVSGTAGWSPAAPGADRTAGDPGWQPRLIVPEHDNESYEWLDQTRQMFARGEWRVRHVDYENAPFGREEYAASAYRWWLGLLAWADRAASSRPLAMSVERAALFADPLLHMLLLAGTTILVAWQFGVFPAALVSIGLVALFPFAAEYLPGAPSDHGLAQALAIWSVLPLLAGIKALHSGGARGRVHAHRWFLLAGVAGGVGLWISVAHQVPLLLGIGLGALMAAGLEGGGSAGKPADGSGTAPWRTWALGGAAASLGAYLVEYFPAHMGSLQLRAVHPLYGLAWLGGGELLAQVSARLRQRKPDPGPPNVGGVLAADAIAAAWIERRRPVRSGRETVAGVLAAAAIAAVPVVMWRARDLGFMELELPALRLTRLPDGPMATNLSAWISRDGPSAMAWATLLPLLLIGPAIWLLGHRATGLGARATIAVALGPVLVALGFACRELSWWNGMDGALLALLAAAAASAPLAVNRTAGRWAWCGLVALVTLPGALQILPRAGADARYALNGAEMVGLVERDLADWLALHAGGRAAVVLAPSNETVTLYYYGGLRGLATLGWENREGFGAAVRIAGASTPEEAREWIERRQVSHIVVPSWDSHLDVYARPEAGQPEDTFMGRLQRWELPPWLRPVAYPIPRIAGLEGQSVAVFEVVEDQDEATAESRLAEYFAETEQAELAASAEAALRRFPADLGALVGRAQVEIARADMDGFGQTMDPLLHCLSGGADRALPWDRRVSLAVVLAQGQQVGLARMELMQCLADVDGAKLRALTAGSLYRMQVLSKALGLGITDPRLHELALGLLPPELRGRLAH